MPRTFVIGDIHGACRALLQCLERSDFDYEHDHLISLGDVCDGWPETKQSVDELMKIKNLTYLLGNHDFWTLQWMQYGIEEDVWLEQGGEATLQSYHHKVDQGHKEFFEKALPYFILNNKLFVHAGIDLWRPVEQQTLQTLIWDRELSKMVFNFHQNQIDKKISPYDEIYIGHTPIPFGKPILTCGVWMMDTGAGWSGVLSMMNVETKEMFISDPVPSLYPGVEGRKKRS